MPGRRDERWPGDRLRGVDEVLRSAPLHGGWFLLDLYVLPESRGRGVAPALVCAVAAEIRRRGGTYVKGQAVNNRAVQRLYDRFAMGFPGADYIVGGRAFRRLAELAGFPARVAVQSLPEKSWNYEL